MHPIFVYALAGLIVIGVLTYLGTETLPRWRARRRHLKNNARVHGMDLGDPGD